MFDLATGAVVREFPDIHSASINISRFGNVLPYLFLTCSFDKSVKAWDMRAPLNSGPVHEAYSDTGNVMVCFSPDDR